MDWTERPINRFWNLGRVVGQYVMTCPAGHLGAEIKLVMIKKAVKLVIPESTSYFLGLDAPSAATVFCHC